MRVAVIVALLALAGCDAGTNGSGGQAGLVRADAAKARAGTAETDLATPRSAFDYRYAFRLPGNRIEAVYESHARGCDQLGPARCRITAMRYKVGDDNSISAVLTVKIDPTLARAFGGAATRAVANAKGVLTDADVAGADTVAAIGRSDTIITRLRDSLGNAEAQLRGPLPADQKAQVTAKADRLRAAIATIGEVDQGAGTSVATTPVIFTYVSGGAIPGVGGSSDATFDVAGDTFLGSLAGLLVVLASIGPWVVLLLGGALILRWILARTEPAAAPTLPPAPRETSDADRNVIQRWFSRDEAKEHERTD